MSQPGGLPGGLYLVEEDDRWDRESWIFRGHAVKGVRLDLRDVQELIGLVAMERPEIVAKAIATTPHAAVIDRLIKDAANAAGER